MKKRDNQWYGKCFEEAIYHLSRGEDFINPYPSHIPENDFSTLLIDAKDFIKQFQKEEPIQSIKWVGKNTITESGDLIINNTPREIKYVSSGLGTWGNYSKTKTLQNFSNTSILSKAKVDNMRLAA